MTSYYEKKNGIYMKEVKQLAPEQLKAFIQFERKVFHPGALSKKEKEMIAVAIAHVTECPYCIDVHTKKAKVLGATLSELTEAIFVVAAIEGESMIVDTDHRREVEDFLNFNLAHLGELIPEEVNAYAHFNAVALKDGNLSESFKELIALAVSYAIQCPTSIDLHTKKALALGITRKQIAEAIMVAVALKAGSAYAHLINLIDSFQD